MRNPFPIVGALLLVAASACSTAEGSGEELLAFECEGKCDGFGTVRSLLKNPKDLDLDDLLAQGASFATEQVNDALSLANGGAEFTETVVYAKADRARGNDRLRDIDSLVTGLAARFGETELTTVVNKARADYLASSDDEVYAESAFRLKANFGHGWSLAAGGLAGASVSVGFDAGAALEGRVIAPFEKERDAFLGAPLEVLSNARGFVLPRSLAEVRAMKPGEVFALRGAGSLGANLGAGVPLLVASPASFLSYSLVFSAALRAQLSGQLDMQLVRLSGDEAVLDVGVSRASAKSASVAVTDGWGVLGVPLAPVTIGNTTVDLSKLADSALRKQLNARLKIVSARAEADKTETRLSVARFRFRVGADDAQVVAAFSQALRGDVRLAQALANRGTPGVSADFDLFRSGVSSLAHAGLDLFGMSFFTTRELAEGSVVVQTPGGARTLLFDSLHQESGWFFSTHGFTRVALSGLTFDAAKPGVVKGEANLFVQVMDGDDYMQRDSLVDDLDALLLALGGQAAFDALAKPGAELEAFVDGYCADRSPLADACYLEAVEDAEAKRIRARARGQFLAAIDARGAGEKALLLSAADLRLAAQHAVDPTNALGGPPSSVVLDYRLDNGALAQLFLGSSATQFRAALENYLGTVGVARTLSATDAARERAEIIDDARADVAKMEAAFGAHAANYKKLVSAESASLRGVGALGPRALEVRFTVDGDDAPKYEEASVQSIPQARAREAAALWDELAKLAKEVHDRPEQAVAYTLMSLATAKRLDVRFDLKSNLQDSRTRNYAHYRAAGYAPFDGWVKGSLVAPMDAGLFTIDALRTVK